MACANESALSRMPAPIADWMAEHSPAEQRIAVALAIVVAGALCGSLHGSR